MNRFQQLLDAGAPEVSGSVTSILGLSVEVRGLKAAVGDVVTIAGATPAEVVAANDRALTCMPLAKTSSLEVGMPVTRSRGFSSVPVGRSLMGRVIDGLGRPIDGKGPLVAEYVAAEHDAPAPMDRERITKPISLGVRAIDTLTPMGLGQRMGLFAGSGVGKSSLLSMIARGSDASINVISLVGERGREVREFLEDDLGPEGLARSIVVVATSDQPAMHRLRAAFTATRIAEEFRDQGEHVMLMMDSLTRVAMAQREIGLAAGEPPATRGYPPSTFPVLARLLERAGTDKTGSITGVYTVLVDGDDHNEPVADTVRSILDGHLVLDRALAVSGHFPAIDVLGSISRLEGKIATREQRATATTLRSVLAAHRDAQDLIGIGAYQAGSNPLVDAGVKHAGEIRGFLTQSMEESPSASQSWDDLTALVSTFGGLT